MNKLRFEILQADKWYPEPIRTGVYYEEEKDLTSLADTLGNRARRFYVNDTSIKLNPGETRFVDILSKWRTK